MKGIDRPEVDGVVRALDRSTDEVAVARGLPMECYTSESFHRFELDAVFGRSWLGLGRVEQVPEPGDWFTVDVAGDPLLVVRGRDGEIRVLSAVCTHRHHLLVEGQGHTDRLFRCPLHSWAFDDTGALIHATGMAGSVFTKADHCLPSLAVEVWNGFIFANHDQDAAPFAPSMAKADEVAAAYHLDELVTSPPVDSGPFPWNWKTMFENGIEPLHTQFLHRGQHDFAPSAEFLPWDDGDGAVLHPTWFDEVDQSFNPLWRGLLEPLPDLTLDQRRQVMFVCALPTLYFGLMPDHVFWMLILPEGPGHVRLRNGILHHPSATALPNFEARIGWVVEGLMMLFAEDSVANTSVQRGRRSRYARPGPYSTEEATLPQMNRWLAERYRDGHARLLASDEQVVDIRLEGAG